MYIGTYLTRFGCKFTKFGYPIYLKKGHCQGHQMQGRPVCPQSEIFNIDKVMFSLKSLSNWCQLLLDFMLNFWQNVYQTFAKPYAFHGFLNKFCQVLTRLISSKLACILFILPLYAMENWKRTSKLQQKKCFFRNFATFLGIFFICRKETSKSHAKKREVKKI